MYLLEIMKRIVDLAFSYKILTQLMNSWTESELYEEIYLIYSRLGADIEYSEPPVLRRR